MRANRVRRFLVIPGLLLACGTMSAHLLGQGVADSAAAKKPITVLRLWDFECGQIHATDQSRWTPNLHVGQAVDLSDN